MPDTHSVRYSDESSIWVSGIPIIGKAGSWLQICRQGEYKALFIGVQLEVDLNNSRSFFIGSYTNIFRIGEFFFE